MLPQNPDELKLIQTEIKEYFSKNIHSGCRIHFILGYLKLPEKTDNPFHRDIVFAVPAGIDEDLTDFDVNFDRDLREIGKKYGIDELRLPYWCYER